MDSAYEQDYARIEERHPWFVARRELFASLVAGQQGARLLDVGCGTGMFLSHLRQQGFEHLSGVETSEALREGFREPGLTLHADFPSGRFDAVFMLDVLEHIADDQGTIARVHQALEPGGSFFVSVPAHPFLWSRHDEVNHHQRRYRRRELRDKLTQAGFELRRLSYWNLTGFPPALANRWLGSGGGSNELERGSSWSLSLYGSLLRLENRLVKSIGLPFGVSLIAIATKPMTSAPPG